MTGTAFSGHSRSRRIRIQAYPGIHSFQGANVIMNTTRWTLAILAAGLACCTNASADHTWLCSVGSAVAVDEDGTVGPPDTGDRERPTFFRLDLDRKELTLLAPKSRRGEVTKFDAVHASEGQWVFTGVEHGRGVSVIVTPEGRMSLSVVGDGVVWSVFGNALLEGDSAEPAETGSTAAAAQESENQTKTDGAETPETESESPADDEAS